MLDPVSAGLLAGGMVGAAALNKGGGGVGGGSMYPTEPAWQVELGKRLMEKAEPKAMERLSKAGEAYPGGEFKLSPYEETGLKGLEKYLSSALPSEKPLFGAAKSELGKTLGGEEYDPIKGPYYQAYRTQILQELEDAKNRIAATTSARDKYFGGGRIATEGRVEERGMANLASVLGSLYERERERKLGAVPEAMRMVSAEDMYPMQRVAASQQYGGLPREIEEMNYSEWVRQLNDLGIPLDVALGIATYKPTYAYKPSSGGSNNYGGLASAIAGLFAGGGGGGAFGLGQGMMAPGTIAPLASQSYNWFQGIPVY